MNKKKKQDKPIIDNEEVPSAEETQDDVNLAEEYKNKYLRALADYQNLENRVEILKKDTENRTKVRILSSFLDVLDHLEKAESFMNDDGLKMVSNQFRETISKLGLEEIDVLGNEYDPYVAEALELVEGEDDNIVVGVIRKGYKVGDDVIRPAQVKVSKIKN